MYRKNDFRRVFLILLALLTASLPFAAPAACAQALAGAVKLCGGSLLMALFPFLIVSTLLVQCGAADLLGLVLRPAARAMGFRAPCSGGILLIGLVGGFAPAANAAAEAYRAGSISREEAAALLPACICSGPSFVILSVGAGMLGSYTLGVRLFAAQVLAGYLTAALLRRGGERRARRQSALAPSGEALAPPRAAAAAEEAARTPPQLYQVIAGAVTTYLRLCGFILYFRFLAGGLAALVPAKVRFLPAVILEVCSGCDLASQTGRWASLWCCAALSVQGVSVLMQVRTICPKEISFAPLLWARVLHLPLSVGLFCLLLPRGSAGVFSTLCARVITMRRVPADCALLVFFGCCLVACRLCRALAGERQKKETLPETSPLADL